MVTKIRIIYTGEDESLKEYLKCFFEFIGVMVCEYRVNCVEDTYRMPYDESVVNIALNDVSNMIEKRNYYARQKLNAISVNSKLRSDINDSKIKIREKILEAVVNKIWKNDSNTCKTLQQIRELYVSSDENKDLYLSLFAKDMCYETNKMVQEQKVKDNDEYHKIGEKYNPIDVPFNAYMSKIFNELINTYVKLGELKEVFSCPYKEFVMLNVQKHLNELLSVFVGEHNISSLLARYFDVTKITKSSVLIEQVKQFLKKCPSIGAYYLAIELYYKNRINTTELCQKLRMEGNKYQERKFYVKAIEYQTLFQKKANTDISRIIPEYKKVYELEPSSFSARYKAAYVAAKDGRFKEAESILDMNLMGAYIKYNNPLFLIGLLQVFGLMLKIGINSVCEYTAQACASHLYDICTKIDSPAFFLNLFDREETCEMYLEVIKPCSKTFYKEIKPLVSCTALKQQLQAIEYRIFESDKAKSIGTIN